MGDCVGYKDFAGLMKRQFAPVRWIVPGILSEGCYLLAGRPKVRKSWLALDLCFAVASGRPALGSVPVEKGCCLLLGLEDNERRLQRRAGQMSADLPEDSLWFVTEHPRAGQGGEERVEDWLMKTSIRGCNRLIVVDTLAQFRARTKGADPYTEDYEAIQGLTKLAGRYRATILVVCHTRKMKADTPGDSVSGTRGLTGAADGFLTLEGGRDGSTAFLGVDGRDIDEPMEYGLRWDAGRCSWSMAGKAEDLRLSEMEAAVVELIRLEGKALSPKDIHLGLVDEHPGLQIGTVRKRLRRMVERGTLIQARYGEYSVSLDRDLQDMGSNPAVEDGKIRVVSGV